MEEEEREIISSEDCSFLWMAGKQPEPVGSLE